MPEDDKKVIIVPIEYEDKTTGEVVNYHVTREEMNNLNQNDRDGSMKAAIHSYMESPRIARMNADALFSAADGCGTDNKRFKRPIRDNQLDSGELLTITTRLKQERPDLYKLIAEDGVINLNELGRACSIANFSADDTMQKPATLGQLQEFNVTPKGKAR